MTTLAQRIIDVLPDPGDGLLARDIAGMIEGISKHTLKVELCRLTAIGAIEREEFGHDGDGRARYLYSKKAEGANGCALRQFPDRER